MPPNVIKMKKYTLAITFLLGAACMIAFSVFGDSVTIDQTNLNSINSTMTEIGNNLYGTSTSMNVSAASTSQGLLGKTDYVRFLSISTTSQAQSNWAEASTSLSDYVKNKPSFATVATTGIYSDLSGKPIIPTGQIQSDWTQTNGALLDYIKNKPANRSWATTTRSIVTTAAAANGFQVSSTRDSEVRYSLTIVSTATISANASGYVALEMAPTNSISASDWIELGRVVNGQAVALALTLASTATGGGQVTGYIPAGYYVRLRSVNSSGTPTYTYNSGEETLLSN